MRVCRLKTEIEYGKIRDEYSKTESMENTEVFDKWKDTKKNLSTSCLPIFHKPRECPQMLDFTGFEGIFNLRGNYRNLS